jgi:hypothetical protein
LSLFRGSVSSIAVGDGARGAQRGEHELVGDDFCLSAGVLSGGFDDVGGKGNGLLPDLEISHGGCHETKMALGIEPSGTKRLHAVQEWRVLQVAPSL